MNVRIKYTAYFFVFILIACSHIAVSQTWEKLPDVPEKFTFPVVAVVNGKIHIMGGGAKGGATNVHYAFDPATNQWSTMAAVPYKAQQPAGEAVRNEIHFFGGGYPNSGSPVDSHYVYSPITNSWRPAAKLTKKRAIHYAVAMYDTLYTLAGQGVAQNFEAYDSGSDNWSPRANLPDSKFWYGAHVVANGKIYRFCGGGYTAPVNTVNVYDPTTDSWSSLSNFPASVHGFKGAAIGSKIYLVGGYYDFSEHPNVWVYDVSTDTYSDGIALPSGRSYHNIVVIDSTLYCIGGSNALDTNMALSFVRLRLNTTTTVEESIDTELRIEYSQDVLEIVLPKHDASLNSNIRIVNYTGQEVLSFRNVDLTNTIQVGRIPAGIYFAEINADGKLYAKKFVVLDN